MKKNNYKCGPNWIPDWLFNDPAFSDCCKHHDDNYANKRGKHSSDYQFLICNMGVAKKEQNMKWKVLNYIQGFLLYILVVVIPYSYVSYYYKK